LSYDADEFADEMIFKNSTQGIVRETPKHCRVTLGVASLTRLSICESLGWLIRIMQKGLITYLAITGNTALARDGTSTFFHSGNSRVIHRYQDRLQLMNTSLVISFSLILISFRNGYSKTDARIPPSSSIVSSMFPPIPIERE